MSDLRWTPEQAEIIQHPKHAMLAASAGSGKTTTVIGKILWHLGVTLGTERDTGWPISPCLGDSRLQVSQIAAITFTEKAAYDLKRKLRERVALHAPEQMWDMQRASVGTIHGFCGDLLRENALRLGTDPTFRVMDEREARLELDEIIKDVVLRRLADVDEGAVKLVQNYSLMGYEHTQGAVDYVRSMLRDVQWHADRYAKWSLQDELDPTVLWELVDQWDAKDHPPLDACATAFRLAQEAKRRWQIYLRDENVRDFDSLVLDARDLLCSPHARPALDSVRRRLRLLIIDEFQDTDEAQRDIAFAITGIGEGEDAPGGVEAPQLLLVGDPKQSIYRFRGADISVWNSARRAIHGDDEPMQLTESFRTDERVVHYVNRVCEGAMKEAAKGVAEAIPGCRIDYSSLGAHRRGTGVADVEWLTAEGRHAKRRTAEAGFVAARIREMIVHSQHGEGEGVDVEDPVTGRRRPCTYRDIAVLFRNRTSLKYFEPALQEFAVPYHLAGDAGLTGRQEILDLLTVLRLLDNPRDDMSAFAYLRSPHVGLRDEVIARIRLEGTGGTLLRQARDHLENGEWFSAPEHAEIVDIEKRALANGIQAIDDLIEVRTRVPIDQLLEEALDRTGYCSHVMLLAQRAPKMANIQRFLRLLQGYRHHTVGTFLEIWDRWENQDLGLPQAPLYSKKDDVVTLSTIHSSKGLEWPVVFLVDTDGAFNFRPSNQLWTDRDLGPVLCPIQADRGPRTERLLARWSAEELAEEARLLYVACTRARDRLVISGPRAEPKGVTEWLSRGVDLAVRQNATPPNVATPSRPPEPSISWIDRVKPGGNTPQLVKPVTVRNVRPTRSATEVMAGRRKRSDWVQRYVHGVIPTWRFAPPRAKREGVPENIKGVLIHGVLERISEEAELAELLDLAIGALDAPELEERLASGSEYRAALDREIRQVVTGEEWEWYVAGEHHRELRFVHLRHAGKWRIGAFDLYRPDDPTGWIVDFKTHDIEAAAAKGKAAEYRLQGAVYRSAARALRGDAKVRFHFTKPDKVVDIELP